MAAIRAADELRRLYEAPSERSQRKLLVPDWPDTNRGGETLPVAGSAEIRDDEELLDQTALGGGESRAAALERYRTTPY